MVSIGVVSSITLLPSTSLVVILFIIRKNINITRTAIEILLILAEETCGKFKSFSMLEPLLLSEGREDHGDGRTGRRRRY